MKDSVSFLPFFLPPSEYWLFLIGRLCSWPQDDCCCSCRHRLPENKRAGRCLGNFVKTREIFSEAPTGFPSYFSDQICVTCPFLKQPKWRRVGSPHGYLILIKILPLRWDRWAGSWLHPGSPETHGQLTPERNEGFFLKVEGLLGRSSDRTVGLRVMSVGCKIGKGQESSA